MQQPFFSYCCSACTSPVPHAAFTDSSRAVPFPWSDGGETFQRHCQTERRRDRERGVGGKELVWGKEKSVSDAGGCRELYRHVGEHRGRNWQTTGKVTCWNGLEANEVRWEEKSVKRREYLLRPYCVVAFRDEDDEMNEAQGQWQGNDWYPIRSQMCSDRCVDAENNSSSWAST